MRIVYCGAGSVGQRCEQVLKGLTPYSLPDILGDQDWADDILLSVHWPSKFTPERLKQFRIGALNLHNSYLPWNRGAHACSWAIVGRTPHGATMHWMDQEFDTGDIFHQERLGMIPGETAHELYQRTADLEVKVFRTSVMRLLDGCRTRIPQIGKGSWHTKKDFDLLTRAVNTSDCRVIKG